MVLGSNVPGDVVSLRFQVVSQIATGAPKGTLLAPPATSRQLPEPNFAWASPYEAINKT